MTAMPLLLLAGPFPVRLSGGPNLCVGRVEVFHQGEWGTVCDDDWDMRDVAVVCRELDCGEALSAPPGAWFGEGTGPIWLNEVRCVGTEWHLHACRHLGFRKHVCTHEEDASAICSGGTPVGRWGLMSSPVIIMSFFMMGLHPPFKDGSWDIDTRRPQKEGSGCRPGLACGFRSLSHSVFKISLQKYVGCQRLQRMRRKANILLHSQGFM